MITLIVATIVFFFVVFAIFATGLKTGRESEREIQEKRTYHGKIEALYEEVQHLLNVTQESQKTFCEEIAQLALLVPTYRMTKVHLDLVFLEDEIRGLRLRIEDGWAKWAKSLVDDEQVV